VDTLNLVLSNDDVLESTSVLDQEDGVLVATLSLTSAANTTAVGLHATIEGAADRLGGLEGNGTLGGGNGEGSALAKGESLAGGGDSRAGGGEASGGSNDGNGELHGDGRLVFDLGSFGLKKRASIKN
jgi:hypothetical protein